MAVWTAAGADGVPVRVVVPTSQVFLDDDAGLGTHALDLRRQKTIFDYGRRDASGRLALSAGLARFLVGASWSAMGQGADALQQARNARSARLGGS